MQWIESRGCHVATVGTIRVVGAGFARPIRANGVTYSLLRDNLSLYKDHLFLAHADNMVA